MKQLSFFTFAIILLIAAPGCKKVFPDGPAVKEARSVSDFTKIEAAFSGDVQFVQGATKSVEVEAAQNIQDYILTEVNGNTLILKTKPNINIKRGRVIIYVSNPNLVGAILSGSGNISANTDISTSAIDLRVSGSGNISLPKLTATTVNANITGSGNISINGGVAQGQEITISGNGNYHTQQMQSKTAKIKLTGSGETKIWADDALDIAISGSGDVWYNGSPTINSTISGSGKVRKM